jgi:hypothetical protein
MGAIWIFKFPMIAFETGNEWLDVLFRSNRRQFVVTFVRGHLTPLCGYVLSQHGEDASNIQIDWNPNGEGSLQPPIAQLFSDGREVVGIPRKYVLDVFDHFFDLLSSGAMTLRPGPMPPGAAQSLGDPDTRAILATIWTTISVAWSVLHEMAHLLNGHAYLEWSGENRRIQFDIEFSSSALTKLDYRTFEYDADAFATKWLVLTMPMRRMVNQLRPMLDCLTDVAGKGSPEDSTYLYWQFRSVLTTLHQFDRLEPGRDRPYEDRWHLIFRERMIGLTSWAHAYLPSHGHTAGSMPHVEQAMFDAMASSHRHTPPHRESTGLSAILQTNFVYVKRMEDCANNWPSLRPMLVKLARNGERLAPAQYRAKPR